jgi:hypothetical protein
VVGTTVSRISIINIGGSMGKPYRQVGEEVIIGTLAAPITAVIVGDPTWVKQEWVKQDPAHVGFMNPIENRMYAMGFFSKRDRYWHPAFSSEAGIIMSTEQFRTVFMNNDDNPEYNSLRDSFKELGVSATVRGRFVLLELPEAKRLLALLTGPKEETIAKKSGTLLRLVTDNTHEEAK